MNKHCPDCKTEKDISFFRKNKSTKDGLQFLCKSCQSDRFKKYLVLNKKKHVALVTASKERRKRALRAFLVEHFTSNPCVDCGESDIRVLEFDHKPNTEKCNGVARIACSGHSLKKLVQEIDKCDVRCKNCHAKKTFARMGGSWHDEYLR